ncbi:LuxR C-terminal-related transcriptional regulator [Microbacterium chocolatum]|uniref:LuxR C-terminal-related transcriptional regulator n=1 Tax=Microbacterium aurantiacum TaxID=162393 RepID=UPI00338F98F9
MSNPVQSSRQLAPSPPTATRRYAPPRPQPHTLDRPRLHDAIDASVRAHRITVVRAPSGFGKTSAVSGWAAGHPRRVAWLSLGTYDDEPSRLGSRVIRALQSLATADSRLSALAAVDPAEAGGGVVFDALHDILAGVDAPVFLVIDDAQRAGDALTGGLLGALIDAGPEQLRLVFVGTGSIDARLARWTLGTPDTVITDAQLAFDVTEIAAVLSDTDATTATDVDTPTPPLPGDVLAGTGGWPIAVQFARLSGRRRPGLAGAPDTGAQTTTALLRDYVRDNVMRDIPDDLRRLALDTAVCEELTVPLAEALTGRTDAAALLARATRGGLFLSASDTADTPTPADTTDATEVTAPSHPTTYRWHPLFAKLCRAISDEEDPARNARAHRAAARHLERDDPFGAIYHWQRADESEEVARVIVEHWVRIVIEADTAALDRICAALPTPFDNDPAILLIRACAADILGAPHAARTFLAQAVARAGATPDAAFAMTLPRAQLFLLDDRAALAAAADSVHAGLIADTQIDRHVHAALLFLLGWAGMRHRLTPARTIDQLRTAVTEADAVGDEILATRARRLLSFTLAWAGALRDAGRVLDRLGAAAEDDRPWLANGGGATTVAMGIIAYWAEDHETAARHFIRAVSGERAAPSFRGVAAVMLALTAARTHDDRLAARASIELDTLPRGERHGVSWGAFRDLADAALADSRGRTDDAVAIAERHTASNLPLVTMVFAELIRRAGDAERALEMLRGLGPYREVTYVRAATMLTAALVHAERGAERLAHELCEQALEIGDREGLDRLFVGAEPAVRQLLADHLQRGTAHEELAARAARPAATSGPISMLSDRERAVLDLLGTRKTAGEIAETLHVSVNTLKTHTRSIYRKLGVNSREEAVQSVR